MMMMMIVDLSKIEGISNSTSMYEKPKEGVVECELQGLGTRAVNEGIYAKLLTSKS